MKMTMMARLVAMLGSALFATVTTAGLAAWMAVSAEQASPDFAAASKVAPQVAPKLVSAALVHGASRFLAPDA